MLYKWNHTASDLLRLATSFSPHLLPQYYALAYSWVMFLNPLCQFIWPPPTLMGSESGTFYCHVGWKSRIPMWSPLTLWQWDLSNNKWRWKPVSPPSLLDTLPGAGCERCLVTARWKGKSKLPIQRLLMGRGVIGLWFFLWFWLG